MAKKQIVPDEDVQLWPRWLLDDLAGPIRAKLASVFIVHGNTSDICANPDVGVENDKYISADILWKKFLDGRPLVMFYDIASGLTFLNPAMEADFRQAAGMGDPAGGGGGGGRRNRGGSGGPDAADPIAAARAQLAASQEIPRDPNACLALVDKALRARPNSVLLIQDAHLVLPTSGPGMILPPGDRVLIETAKNWGRDPNLRSNGSVVFLLTPEAYQISAELRGEDSEIRLVRVPKPDDKGRLDYIKALTEEPPEVREAREEMLELAEQARQSGLRKATREQFKARIQQIYDSIHGLRADYSLPNDLTPETLARACQGMSLRQMREIFLQANEVGEPISLTFAKAKKREILNREYGEVMEVVEARRGLDDIGGHEHIKAYFREVLDAIRRGEDRLVPMGVLLSGPPGTGKTAIVEALAFEAGYNFIKTKNIRNMFVGESEARMDKLISGLKALAPVVVMNDEADLNEADRDAYKGDSGVSERLMKAWMELLSDPRIRGKIIVISCTNRPDRIDAALKRSGRSDERILMPMPSEIERLAIFPVMFKRHAIPTAVKDFAPFAAAAMSGPLSGADIEQVVLRSFRFTASGGRAEVSEADLRQAIADFIPSANQKDIDTMTLAGLSECSSRRLLPPHLADIVAGIRERGLAENMDATLASLEARGMLAAA